LRATLPSIIHIKASSPASGPLRRTLEILATEAGAGAPGEGVVVDRLADILLAQALRAYIAETGINRTSWLAGLANPKLARSLRSFHSDVAAEWSVASMASAAGMSRCSFAEKFKAVVGRDDKFRRLNHVTPMHNAASRKSYRTDVDRQAFSFAPQGKDLYAADLAFTFRPLPPIASCRCRHLRRR
jgi:AraC-like DNA-binding protein